VQVALDLPASLHAYNPLGPPRAVGGAGEP
jgi:hypothetical protein